MAAGYARSSGRVGVFLVTSGPGATNSVTPIRDCQADSIPVVLICGQVPRAAMGTDAFQEAPVFNIMAACAKHVFLVTDETKIEATMRTRLRHRAQRPAGSGRRRHPEGRAERAGRLQGRRAAAAARLPGAHRRARRATHVAPADAEAFFKLLGAGRAAAPLRRRRRHQRRRGGRAARLRASASASRS